MMEKQKQKQLKYKQQLYKSICMKINLFLLSFRLDHVLQFVSHKVWSLVEV